MYTGHLGVALASVRLRRGIPLWLLLVASQGPDWVQLVLDALGVAAPHEYSSHSIIAVGLGSALLGAGYGLAVKDWRGGAIVAGVYLTHPLLDLATDSKLWWAGGPLVGGCAYNHPVQDLLIEAAVGLAGWLVYRSTLGARRNSWQVWAILAALLGLQAALDAGQTVRLARLNSRWAGCVQILSS